MKRFLRHFAITLGLVLAVFLCALEVVFTPYFSPPLSPAEIEARFDATRRSGTMPQYAHSPYWSVAFIDAFDRLADARYQDENGQAANHSISLPGYTIIDSVRVTTDQPAHCTRKVWVYGSSTMWGVYVADGWTIASYLQRLLNQHKIAWCVINMAQPSATARIEYYWLTKKSQVRSGDAVIFVNGVVDLAFTTGQAYRNRRNEMLICQISDKVSFAVLRALCASATAGQPEDWRIEPDVLRYKQAITMARAWVVQHGARWVHIVQPNMPPTDGWESQWIVRMANGDPVLDQVPVEHTFDPLHYDDTGNEMVARQILDLIVPEF